MKYDDFQQLLRDGGKRKHKNDKEHAPTPDELEAKRSIGQELIRVFARKGRPAIRL